MCTTKKQSAVLDIKGQVACDALSIPIVIKPLPTVNFKVTVSTTVKSKHGVKYKVDMVPLYALRGYLSSKKWSS